MPERDEVTIPGSLRFISDGTTIGSRLECLGHDGRWTMVRGPANLSIEARGDDPRGIVRAKVTLPEMPIDITLAPRTLVYELAPREVEKKADVKGGLYRLMYWVVMLIVIFPLLVGAAIGAAKLEIALLNYWGLGLIL